MNHFGGAGWNLQDAFFTIIPIGTANDPGGVGSMAGLTPEEVVPALAIRIETNAGKKDCP